MSASCVPAVVTAESPAAVVVAKESAAAAVHIQEPASDAIVFTNIEDCGVAVGGFVGRIYNGTIFYNGLHLYDG